MDRTQSIYDQEMRRRRIQEALLQESMPQGTQYTPGPYSRAVPYSPIQGLTQLGQALIARGSMDRGDERIEQAIQDEEEKRKRLAEAVMKAHQGTPGVPAETAPLLGPETFPAGTQEITPAQPAIPGDPQKAMLLAASQPETAEMAKYMAMAEKGSRGQYFTPETVFTEDGRIVTRILNRRTGDLEPVGTVEPISSKDPKARAAVKAAEEGAAMEEKRKFNMSGIGSAIEEARKILKTGKPTESYAGAAWDFVGRTVGYVPEGASEAAQLETLGGALTSKVPRMEGPQSDYDQQLYREMAAQVGVKTLPIETRLKALDTMEKLWAKYERLQPTEKPEEVPPELWEVMTPEERALWQQ